jgi:hypothetical protein
VLCEWLEGREPEAPPRAASHGESAVVLERLILPLRSERLEGERERDFKRRRQSLCFPGLVVRYRLVVRGVLCNAKRREGFRRLWRGDPMRVWRHCAELYMRRGEVQVCCF